MTIATALRRLMTLVAAAGVALVIASPGRALAATTYYVAPSGSDGGSCAANSSAAPFKTIQKAIGCTVSGDAVSLAPSGSTPYPGIGAVSDNIIIHAATGANARSVTVDASVPNVFQTFPVNGSLTVNPGASVELDDVTVTCQQNACQYPTVINQGTLTLLRDAVTGNTTETAILNQPPSGTSPAAHLTVLNSTIAHNSATGLGIGATGGAENAGGIVNSFNAQATIANTTITDNSDSRGAGNAGGIYAAASASTALTLLNDTITNNHMTGTGTNTSPAPGGVIVAAASGNPTLAAANTIIAANTTTSSAGGPDCAGPINDTSGGHNLIGDPTNCTGQTANDQTGSATTPLDPGLNPLANNGGPTDTMAAQAASPALAAGSQSACTAAPVNDLDQRGHPRHTTTRGCDVGAYDTGGTATPNHTYYVAPSGSDGGSCAANSSAAPFKTIQKAIGCTVSGDAVSLAPSGSTPYPGIGAVSDNIIIHAATGANARSVTVDASVPNVFQTFPVNGSLTVNPGASVELDDVTVTCQQNACQYPTVINQGTLTLLRDAVTGNTTETAILNQPPSGTSPAAHLTVLNSTIAHNSATGLGIGATGGAENAGGIVNSFNAQATIANTTITDNSDSRGAGNAGGIYAAASASTALTLLNDTITNNHMTGTGTNTSPAPGGVIVAAASGNPTLAAANTIIAANTTTSSAGGPDCAGPINDTSGGHNLIGDPTNCTGQTANDQTGSATTPLDPGLNPLANNGGPTDTMSPTLSSPVVNAGSPSACLVFPVPNIDQRGVTRSADSRNTCDAGAYDTGGIVASPAAGARANGIAFSPDGSRAYVTNAADGTVTVLDSSSATPHSIATVHVGLLPDGIAVSPSGTAIYVANLSSGTVSVINAATNTVSRTITVGAKPNGIATTSVNDIPFAYVANLGSGSVSVINLTTGLVVRTITVGGGPSGVVASPDGSTVYVANSSLNRVSVINTLTNTVTQTITAGGTPAYDALSPDGRTLYVAEPTANQIAVYNVATSTASFTRAVPVPGAPYGVTASPDGNVVYATASGANAVAVFGSAASSPFSVVPVGQLPDGATFTPNGRYVYVANETSATVSVLPVDEAVPAGSAAPLAMRAGERHPGQAVRAHISAATARTHALRALRRRAARHRRLIRHFRLGTMPVR